MKWARGGSDAVSQNFKYLYNKPIAEMLETPQFLNILAAEHEHLVMVSITLHSDAFARFERKLGEAFESSSYSETAKAWNEERSRVVQEALEGHLIPVGVKWIREWLRDEVEDWLSKRCAVELRNVSLHVCSCPVRLTAGSASMSRHTLLPALSLETPPRFSPSPGVRAIRKRMR